MSEHDPPILILGIPRSGTTWIATLLGRAEGACYVHEPDNETHHPFSLRAKRGLGRFPSLRPGERAPAYETCWEGAFAGGGWTRRNEYLRRMINRGSYAPVEAWVDPDRTDPLRVALIARAAVPGRPRPKRPVVKSVHALLSAEWIARRYDPVVVLVRRQPLNVVASWRWASDGTPRESGLEYAGAIRPSIPAHALDAAEPPPAGDRLARLAWFVGFLAAAREEVAARIGAVCVDHDAICRDPRGELRALAAVLRLDWGDRCERQLERTEAPGDGFTINRIAAEQPGRWRERLSAEEAEKVERVLSGFPGGPWFGSPPP